MPLPENLKQFLASRAGKTVFVIAVSLLLLLLVVPVAIGLITESRLKAWTDEANGKLKTIPIRFELASFDRGLFGSDAAHHVVSPCPPNENLFKLTHHITPFPYAGWAWARVETRVEFPSDAPQQLREILSGSQPFVATTQVGFSGLSGRFILPAREIREDAVVVKLGELSGEWTHGDATQFMVNLAQLGAGKDEEGVTLKDITIKTNVRPSMVKALKEGDGSLTINSLETSGPFRLVTGGLVISTSTRISADQAQSEVSFQADRFEMKRQNDAVQFNKAVLGLEISGLDVQALLAYQKQIETMDQCLPPPEQMQLAMLALKKLLDAQMVSGLKGGIKQASVTFPEGLVGLKADLALAPQKGAQGQPAPGRLSGQLSLTMGRKVVLKLMEMATGMPPEFAGEQIDGLLKDRTLVASGENLSAVLTFNQSGAQLNGHDIGDFETLMQRFIPTEAEAPLEMPEGFEAPAAPAYH